MFKGKSILIIDDDPSILTSLKSVLSLKKLHVYTAVNGKEGLKALTEFSPHIVLVDYQMPEMDGLTFLKAAKSIKPEIPIISMTACGNKTLSISFLKEGATRYLEKPFDYDELVHILKDIFEKNELVTENKQLHSLIDGQPSFSNIIGHSTAMNQVFNLIKKVAKTDVTILIEGESGTGKELIANALHSNSLVKDGPFIPFNCAALPESLLESELFGYEKGSFTGAEHKRKGRFELANDGTLFLDEVGELSLATQAKLLRILQEKKFERIGGEKEICTNARIVAATNRNLRSMVEKGLFREDLFYRLSVFPIPLPSLNEREKDIELLANYFLSFYSRKYEKDIKGFSKESIEKINTHHWKGNVRELENKISQTVILTQNTLIQTEDLQLNPTTNEPIKKVALNKKLTETELCKEYAKLVYEQLNKNKSETAKFLNINYRTLIKRLS